MPKYPCQLQRVVTAFLTMAGENSRGGPVSAGLPTPPKPSRVLFKQKERSRLTPRLANAMWLRCFRDNFADKHNWFVKLAPKWKPMTSWELWEIFLCICMSLSLSLFGEGSFEEKQCLFQQKAVELEMHSRISVVKDGWMSCFFFLEFSLGTSRPTSRIPGDQALIFMLQALKVRDVWQIWSPKENSQRGTTFIVVMMSFLKRDWLALDCYNRIIHDPSSITKKSWKTTSPKWALQDNWWHLELVFSFCLCFFLGRLSMPWLFDVSWCILLCLESLFGSANKSQPSRSSIRDCTSRFFWAITNVFSGPGGLVGLENACWVGNSSMATLGEESVKSSSIFVLSWGNQSETVSLWIVCRPLLFCENLRVIGR